MKQMKHPKISLLLAAMAVLTLAPTAHAYVGPGVASSTIVLVLGILGSILIWVFALVWYPFKHLWRRWRGSEQVVEDAEHTASSKGDVAPPQ